MEPHYQFERNSRITVHLHDAYTSARNASGDFVPALPQIKMAVDFCGEWSSEEKMREDLRECLSKLRDAFEKHLSSAHPDRGNNRNQYW